MTDTPRYSRWLRRLHWLIALLVIAALVTIEIRGNFPRGSALRSGLRSAHMQFGIAVLLLMLPRLLQRLRERAPAIVPPLPSWQRIPAKLLHVALYALLFALPLLGIAMMMIGGKPVAFLGIALPVAATPDAALSASLKDIHETLGEVLMWMAIVHVLAALVHHALRRDTTLRRMLPPI